MTTVATLSVPVHREAADPPQSVPWRRMVWVTWRQHRTALIAVSLLLGALAVFVWISGLALRHAFAAAVACHPAGSFVCSELVNNFNGMNGYLANGLAVQVLPALIGAFIAAPVLARELETGTFRYAWTQGIGRWRWTIAKLVGLAVVTTAVFAALSILLSWYYQPYFSAGQYAQSVFKDVQLTASPFSPGLFDLRGVTFAVWALAAFAIGIFSGMLLRRVVPAIVATLAVYVGLVLATTGWLREHYLAPLTTTSLNVPQSTWVLSQQWFTKGGKPVSQAALGQVLQGTQFAGKGGVPQALSTWQYLVDRGYTQVTAYQPYSRFWPFQWIEAGWLFALTLILIAATLWLVRRRVI